MQQCEMFYVQFPTSIYFKTVFELRIYLRLLLLLGVRTPRNPSQRVLDLQSEPERQSIESILDL